MSQLLQELLRKAEQLNPEEQVQLIEHLVHKTSCTNNFVNAQMLFEICNLEN